MKRFILSKLICLTSLTFCISSQAGSIHPHGFWIGADVEHQHCFDSSLAQALGAFFLMENATSVVDFGCGNGKYVKAFLNQRIPCEGYDGNPSTPILTSGLGKVLDLSENINLQKKYDWVLSLEVGEHIPSQFETIFICNLIRHCRDGIVLSWAVEGQGGHGHFNERNNAYIKEIFASRGFENDVSSENILRDYSTLPWFKNTIMVLRRKKLGSN